MSHTFSSNMSLRRVKKMEQYDVPKKLHPITFQLRSGGILVPCNEWFWNPTSFMTAWEMKLCMSVLKKVAPGRVIMAIIKHTVMRSELQQEVSRWTTQGFDKISAMELIHFKKSIKSGELRRNHIKQELSDCRLWIICIVFVLLASWVSCIFVVKIEFVYAHASNCILPFPPKNNSTIHHKQSKLVKIIKEDVSM